MASTPYPVLVLIGSKGSTKIKSFEVDLSFISKYNKGHGEVRMKFW